MNRYLLFSIILCAAMTIKAQIKIIPVEPVYVAIKLLNTPNPEDYRSVCAFYGYSEQEEQHVGEHIFSDGKGSKAIWIDPLDGGNEAIRELRFETVQKTKDIENALLECGFKKTTSPQIDKSSINGIRYEKSIPITGQTKVCIIQSGSPNILHLFHRYR